MHIDFQNAYLAYLTYYVYCIYFTYYAYSSYCAYLAYSVLSEICHTVNYSLDEENKKAVSSKGGIIDNVMIGNDK
jgi:hypothetical protein